MVMLLSHKHSSASSAALQNAVGHCWGDRMARREQQSCENKMNLDGGMSKSEQALLVLA